MSEVKNKNFSFREVVFASNKLVSLIAATMLLLLVDGIIHETSARPYNGFSVGDKLGTNNAGKGNGGDGGRGINNSASASCSSLDCVTMTPRTQPQPTQEQAKSDIKEAITNQNFYAYQYASLRIASGQVGYGMNKEQFIASMTKLYMETGITPQQMYELTVDRQFFDSSNFYAASCAIFWCSFAPPQSTQQTSAQTTAFQQELASTGNSATQTPYPVKVCDALFNGQNLCTEQTVTAVVGALAVGLIGGIVAIIQTEINNKQNTDKQIENSKNLLTLLYLSQQKQAPCVPTQQNNFCGTVP